jgi:hypothetical protein
MLARTENAPEGISIDDLPSDELAFNDFLKVMVIPSGLTKETLNHLTRLGSHGLNIQYDSLHKLINLNNEPL